MSDEPPPSGDDKKPKRTFDVRAPRASQSTKDSALYQPRPPREARPRPSRDRRPDERSRRVAPSEAGPQAASSERPAPPIAAAAKPIAEAVPAPKPAPIERPVPKPQPKPQPKAEAPPPPTPAASSSVEEELRILGARPVSEARQKKKKDKPRTAREALQARTSNAPRPISAGSAKPTKAKPSLQAAPSAAAEERRAEDEEPESDEAPDSTPSEPPAAKPGLWSKLRRFIIGR